MAQDMLSVDDPQLLEFIKNISDNGIISDEASDENYNTESEENANNSEE